LITFELLDVAVVLLELDVLLGLDVVFPDPLPVPAAPVAVLSKGLSTAALMTLPSAFEAIEEPAVTSGAVTVAAPGLPAPRTWAAVVRPPLPGVTRPPATVPDATPIPDGLTGATAAGPEARGVEATAVEALPAATALAEAPLPAPTAGCATDPDEIPLPEPTAACVVDPDGIPVPEPTVA
jgi:hypothetical protein